MELMSMIYKYIQIYEIFITKGSIVCGRLKKLYRRGGTDLKKNKADRHF